MNILASWTIIFHQSSLMAHRWLSHFHLGRFATSTILNRGSHDPPVRHNFLFFPARRPRPPPSCSWAWAPSPPAVQLTPPLPHPRPHLGRPHPMGALPWHPRRERLAKLRRRRLTSLDLQRLDPLLGCGGPAASVATAGTAPWHRQHTREKVELVGKSTRVFG
jgi:hypothetical protein